jgi:hypothetical protein
MKGIYCDEELEEGSPKVTITGMRTIPADGCFFEDGIVIRYHRECFFKIPPG